MCEDEREWGSIQHWQNTQPQIGWRKEHKGALVPRAEGEMKKMKGRESVIIHWEESEKILPCKDYGWDKQLSANMWTCYVRAWQRLNELLHNGLCDLWQRQGLISLNHKLARSQILVRKDRETNLCKMSPATRGSIEKSITRMTVSNCVKMQSLQIFNNKKKYND